VPNESWWPTASLSDIIHEIFRIWEEKMCRTQGKVNMYSLELWYLMENQNTVKISPRWWKWIQTTCVQRLHGMPYLANSLILSLLLIQSHVFHQVYFILSWVRNYEYHYKMLLLFWKLKFRTNIFWFISAFFYS
jgi:hypothetical protein